MALLGLPLRAAILLAYVLTGETGLLFNTVHNIQSDVPPENIIAMCEALQEFGSYG